MYSITTFNSLPTNGKAPISPYNDKTFDFITLNVDKPSDLLRILSQNFILNIPLKIEKIHTFRRVESLKNYFVENVQYIILDLDKIYTLENQNKILQYFKNYKCIIGESRSNNNVDNFNLKGFLFCDLSALHLKYAIQQLHYDLIDLCDVDEAAGRRACLNAPIFKYKIVFDNTNCEKILTFDDINVLPKQDKFINNFNLNDIKNIEYTDYKSIEDLCLQTFQYMGFSVVSSNTDGSLSFKHPKEKKTPGGYFWYKNSPYIMHHFNKSKSINIFDYIRNNPLYKELARKHIDYEKQLEIEYKNYNVIEVNDKFLTLTPAIEDSIKSFLDKKNGIYAIKSPMGTGKSTIIKFIIDEAVQIDMRILIITNRISVAEDFKEKYKLKLYNQDSYQIGDNLICQFDSLYKYDIKNFDIVILDEFISLLFHSRSSLNSNSINIAKFFASFNLKLVIADAFLTGYESKLINKTSNLFLLKNNWRDDVQIFNYLHFNYFIKMLINCALKNKVTISSTSLSIINSLQLLFTDLNLKVITLTAETPPSTKQLIYNLFQQENHDKWDVLLYSPTLTVGVSNLNTVKYHFHYDSSMTTDVVSSIQMIKRTRKAQQIHIYIKSRTNYLDTDFDDLKNSYLENIRDVAEYNYLFNINDYGEPILNQIGKKCLLIDTYKNILEFNHKESFLYLIKYHFKNKLIDMPNSINDNQLLSYQKESEKNNKKIIFELVQQYLKLNDIEDNFLDYSKINDSIYKDKLLNILNNFDQLISIVDKDTKLQIFKLCINDTQFISKCKHYKLLKQYIENQITDIDIQFYISNAIIKNNLNDINMFKNVKLFKGIKKLEDTYRNIKNYKFKQYLLLSGYKNINNGLKLLSVDNNVKNFYMYFKY